MFNDFEFEFQNTTCICTSWTRRNIQSDPFYLANFVKSNTCRAEKLVYILRYHLKAPCRGSIYEIYVERRNPEMVYLLALKISRAMNKEFIDEMNHDSITFEFIYQ